MDKIKNFEVNSARWLSLDDFEEEVWKDVPSFEGWYKVSNYGRVKSECREITKRGNGNSVVQRIYPPHIMTAHDNGHGYLWVRLGGRRNVRFYIHRLVAMAFLPNPHTKTDVDHINTNRKDNSIVNLRWVSKSENARNPITLEKNRISQSKPIVLLNCWGEYQGEFYGAQDLADYLGIERSVINDTISQKRSARFANGYIVIRKSEYDPNKNYIKMYKRGTSKFNFIPNERMVLVFRNNKLCKVFQNTQAAADFYNVGISWISKLCRDSGKNIEHSRGGNLILDRLFYFKDVPDTFQEEAIKLFRGSSMVDTKRMSSAAVSFFGGE